MPIINDVEVEECMHLDEWQHCDICQELIRSVPHRSTCLTVQDIECKYYKNCYFKQLQRIKAETAELKNRLMILDEKTVTVQITTDEFEEFKNLKNENAKLKERKNDFFNQAEISHQAVLDKNKIIENLEKTLQEIKDLCQRQDLNQGMRYFEILKLIKKAEEQ